MGIKVINASTQKDDFCVNLFDTNGDYVVFSDDDDVDFIDTKIDDSCNYVVVHHKSDDSQRIFSLKTFTYTSDKFSNRYRIVGSLCRRRNFEYYNSDLAIVLDTDLEEPYITYGYALYSLSQGKMLSDFFKATHRESIFYNLNGKATELQFETLINKRNDYQEAMLIMYDGKLYPLNVFNQKSGQILDEYFSKKINQI